MKTLGFINTALLATATMAVGDELAVAAPKPENSKNVVILHVDDLGWRDLGCMGSPVYETPHIDALAESGIRFTSAYAAAPICTPSRACMLTGSQTSRHGVYTVVKNRGKNTAWKVVPENNNQFLPKEFPTIGTVLSEAGIANGAIGKWHVAVGSPSHGFSEGKYGGYLGLPINYFAPFELGFLPKDVPDGSYLPEYVREAGVDFLEAHKDEPFFLYFATYLPHDEINNKGEDSDATGMFRLAAPAPVVEKYRKKIRKIQATGQDLQGHTNAVYAAMIEETDRSVGAIMQKLDQLGLRENTLVLFISDNGGLSKYTSNKPLRGEKGTLYEGGIRVPMIASMPGRIPAGKVSDEPVSGIDFYPTICAFMGIGPAGRDNVDGEDLSPILFDGKSLDDRNLFWTFPVYLNPNEPAKCPRTAIRRGGWKLIHRYEDNGYALYNLDTDIGESKDLSDSRPEILSMMKSELENCYDRFSAVKTLAPNPDFAGRPAAEYKNF
jgi:arylsulfatase A-like enzyme